MDVQRLLILDTNVLSELMRDQPDQKIVDWLNDQPRATVWTSAVTQFELQYGIQSLLTRRRRLALQGALVRLLVEKIEGRVAPFDAAAADATAALMAERRRAGRTGELRDCMIAGIATSAGAILATRNTRHFADLSIAVIDPWAA